MRNKLAKILICVGCVLVGIIGMGVVVYFYPNEVVKTITEKSVSITATGFSEAVDKVEDAVVVVENYQKNTLAGTGTGFVYDKDEDYGYIITNHHVIEDAETITITFSDESETTATLVGSDEYADIAVLKVDIKNIKDVAIIGSSKDMEKGDLVFTIGNPMGKEYMGTVTQGILSNKDRLVSVSISGYTTDWIMNVMQTDAAINPGNSGGPLCNANGEVIGVNSMKIVETTVEGIGFAIPIEDAITYATALRESGKINRPYVGVSMVNASSTYELYYNRLSVDNDITEGVVVAGVEKGSPAEEAGLQKGDVIIKIDDTEVADIAEFRYKLYTYKVGDTIEITINRNGKEKELKVKLASN